ncbi:1-acyl-sn-glycerol-3-phosphate acyltransferase, partial [bacterium]|nr:1-acyl-sn-glycerol-3-phosphate acyltransferase [bacterium]
MVKKLVRTTVSYVSLLIVIFLIGVPCFLMTLLPARWRYDNKLFFWLSHVFYIAALKTSMVPITVIGKENIPNEPVIIVANHQSSMDIPLIGSLVNSFSHIWLAKSGLKRYWIGPIVRRMAILIDMSTPQKGLRSLVKAINMIKGKKRHAIVFPEGARFIGDNSVREVFSG